MFDRVWVRGSVCVGDTVCELCVSVSVGSERDIEGERVRESQRGSKWARRGEYECGSTCFAG